MRKTVLVVGACVALGGCALPVPIQVASWAADIISVVATEKSLTDHGISALTNRDCALHRAVTEEDNVICREVDDRADTVLVAGAEDPGGQTSKQALAAEDKQSRARVPAFEAIESQVARAPAEDAASFETAAGTDAAQGQSQGAAEQPVTVKVDMAALQPVAEPVDRPYVKVNVQAMAKTVRTAAAGETEADGRPRAGFYYVIGSFRAPDRAKRHMRTHRGLEPAVLEGRIGRDGRYVFRVVVGPLDTAERKMVFRQIKRAGIADTWAIRVSPKDWSVAARVEPIQQADASAALNARDWPGLAAFTTHR